jgi:hypothetical protein
MLRKTTPTKTKYKDLFPSVKASATRAGSGTSTRLAPVILLRHAHTGAQLATTLEEFTETVGALPPSSAAAVAALLDSDGLLPTPCERS